MHLKRLITAVIILPLLYLYIMKLPPVYFNALISAAGLVALWEFLSMYKAAKTELFPALLSGAGLLVLTGFRHLSLETFVIIFMVLTVVRLLTRPPIMALKDIAVPVIALVYIPGLVSYQIFLNMRFGPQWIIFLYGTVWAADSFAFYAGSTIGRRKLYPSVSPNKTVEGAAGSVAGGLLAALLLRWVFSLPLTVPQTAAAGLILGTTAVLGDLVESMFKRDAGVKDSSHLIPGHGGILDKMDGSLFSAPVLYWLLAGIGG